MKKTNCQTLFLYSEKLNNGKTITGQKFCLIAAPSAGLRLLWPQGIFQVWPKLMIKVNKKTKKLY